MIDGRRMNRRVAAAALALTIAQADPSLAAAAPAPGPTVSELIVTASKTVSELTVTAAAKCLEPEAFSERAERPKVVSSYPAKGAVVRPGLLIIRVTFDRPMACYGLFTRAAPRTNPCPDTPQHMLLSYDRRTVRTVCIVEPGVDYGLWMSQDPNAHSFLGLTGLPSVAYRLDFATSAEAPLTSVCEALVADTVTARQIAARGNPACPGEPAAGGG
jgi:hypothetical protein